MNEKKIEPAGLSQADFEAQRRVIALEILGQTKELIAWDLEFNKHVTNLAAALVERLKTDPKVLESNMDINDILKQIRNEKGADSGITGSDIIGGNAWDDIWSVIKEILLGEKDFIESIITKILGL